MIANFSIAISTYNNRIDDAIKLSKELQQICQIIIIHQVTSHCNKPPIPEGIKYFRLNSKGVAKSRNAALNYADTKYLWFLDDDVTVDVKCTKDFIQKLINRQTDFDIITIGVLDENKNPRKKFPKKPIRHNLLSILSVGTIEIIVNRDKVVNKKCYFPEDMGAGSELPVADEPVFLAHCLKAGLVARFVPAFLVCHPFESSGSQFSNIMASRSRGVAFRRIFGLTNGTILLTAMFFKNLLNKKIAPKYFFNSFKSALCGLLKNK